MTEEEHVHAIYLLYKEKYPSHDGMIEPDVYSQLLQELAEKEWLVEVLTAVNQQWAANERDLFDFAERFFPNEIQKKVVKSKGSAKRNHK